MTLMPRSWQAPHHRTKRCEVAEVRVEALQVDLPVPVVAIHARVGVHVQNDRADPQRP